MSAASIMLHISRTCSCYSVLDKHEFRVDRGEATVTATAVLWLQNKPNLSPTVMTNFWKQTARENLRTSGNASHQRAHPNCWTALPHPVLCWHADLAEVLKGIRALAPNSPDIAVAMDSNQQLVDNYIKVVLLALQASLTSVMSVHCCTTKPNPPHFMHHFVTLKYRLWPP